MPNPALTRTRSERRAGASRTAYAAWRRLTQHSLPGGSPGPAGPSLHRLDRASLWSAYPPRFSVRVDILVRPPSAGNGSPAERLQAQHQPRRAALIAATSIFFIPIIASNTRFASPPPAASASVSTRGVICQETPHLSLHQPHALS